MPCPLCGELRPCPAWLGSTFYRGREFPYSGCPACGSQYCDPMPDDVTLSQMYGPEYVQVADPAIDNPKEPHQVVRWLERARRGTFLDYGCGPGNLLTAAARLGWEVIGVEFDCGVARKVAETTGARVLGCSQAERIEEPVADVLHLGDVIEHLTDLDRQMPEILRLIKPGGVLLAQGPLEGNANLFTALLRLARRARPRRVEMPPYHVLLATARGQRALFRRLGLDELEFRLHEVSWPAPSRLFARDLVRPRALGLFTARRLSQVISALRPGHWGNRFFYAGRRDSPTAG